MDSIGDEKRIRALFSELRFADEQVAPGFTAVWHRAQPRSLKPTRAFNLSFVTATVLLVFALATLAVWNRYSRPTGQFSVTVTLPAEADFPGTRIDQPSEIGRPPAGTHVAVNKDRQATKARAARLAEQRQSRAMAAMLKAAREAKSIESWQSPTAALLTSPSDDLFRSLPQLNENAAEMKSFLPTRANEKEK